MEAAEQKTAIQLLKEIMSIPSVNGRDDEGKVAEYLRQVFEEAGIPACVWRIDETHANVFAVLEGDEKEEPILWNGHLDTVPYGSLSEWKTDPAIPTEQDGFLYGRGASDMKSGLAAMVYSLCAFRLSGKKPGRTIYFLGTCDEERGGLGAESALREQPFQGRVFSEMLIGEPTGCRLGVAQKGCLWLEAEVSGRTSHGAYPEEGLNAIEYAAKLSGDLKTYIESFSHTVLGRSTAQITKLSGGVAPNMTPDSCTMLMDIRMVPGLTEQMVLEKADSLVKKYREGGAKALKICFSVKNSRRAIEISPDHRLARGMARCIRDHGREAGLVGINYFTDASVLAGETMETAVLLFGPGEPGMAHKPNESVELKNYLAAIEILTEYLERETGRNEA